MSRIALVYLYEVLEYMYTLSIFQMSAMLTYSATPAIAQLCLMHMTN